MNESKVPEVGCADPDFERRLREAMVRIGVPAVAAPPLAVYTPSADPQLVQEIKRLNAVIASFVAGLAHAESYLATVNEEDELDEDFLLDPLRNARSAYNEGSK